MNRFHRSVRIALVLLLSLVLLAAPLTGCSGDLKNEKPLIGISWRADTDSEFYVNAAAAIREAGGIPVLLAQVMHEDLQYDRDNVLLNAADAQGALTAEVASLLKQDGYKKSNAAKVAAEVDAVVFTGGEDLSSQLYASPEAWHGIEAEKDYNATRDTNDYMLMDYCLDHNVPVLGLCRGMQLLAVISGGRIIQDIPTYMAEQGLEYAYQHRNQKETPDAYRDYAPHDVVLKEGTIAHKFSGETLIQGAPSWHHQAVESVEGTNLVASGTVNVGGLEMIEILERSDKTFAVGLQYHPEAALDKHLEAQANAAEFMSYQDAMEVFTYLMNLVR